MPSLWQQGITTPPPLQRSCGCAPEQKMIITTQTGLGGVNERDIKVRNDTLDEYYNELQKEIGESMDYIDWDSIEAVYIRMREKETTK
jgi:hypothetical protein